MESVSITASVLEVFSTLGTAVVDFVIAIAQLLTKSDSSPGIVALAFSVLLLGASILYFLRTKAQRKAILEFEGIVTSYEGIPEFAEDFSEFRTRLSEKKPISKAWGLLWEAWDEFCETIVPDDIDGPMRLRNSIRPGSFINVEDLGFGPGFYRILPNIFVSLGLFLTFLGLVAALHEFSQSMTTTEAGGSMEGAMQNFMQIASAKFIMSLVGLLCSILFSMLLRVRSGAIDRHLHQLCLKIERRLVFVSLEDLGFRQLKAATEQREHLREIGMGMVAELQKPLDALPDKITSSIADRMDPIFEKVTSMGTSNMEGLVGDLSDQLSHSVGNALNRASESLGEASDRIGSMVDRMNTSNAQAGEGLQTALEQLGTALAEMRAEVASSGESASNAMNEGAEKLLGVMNETLSGIRDNTSDGARAMSEAADNLKSAADGFRKQISAATEDGVSAVQTRMAQSSEEASGAIAGAGKTLLASFDETSQQIARLGTEMGASIGDELFGHIQQIGQQLEALSESIQLSASGAQSAARGLKDGAHSISSASESFGTASHQMILASEPLRASHERIESSLTKLGGTIEKVSATLNHHSTSIAENASRVLDTAQTALGNEREGIRNSMESTRATLAQLSKEADKLDEIDEKLGRALKQYNTQLEAALGSAQDHVSQMRDTLAPGIDTLKSVVEQAESFMPAQARRA